MLRLRAWRRSLERDRHRQYERAGVVGRDLRSIRPLGYSPTLERQLLSSQPGGAPSRRQWQPHVFARPPPEDHVHACWRAAVRG